MSPKIIFTTVKKDRTGQPERQADAPDDSSFSEMFEDIVSSKNVAMLRPNRVFNPPMDIYETPGLFIVKLEIAGIAPDLVTIEWVGYDLIIRGIRKENNVKKPTHYHQVEIHYGSFERIIRLSRRVNPQGTKASYTDGFLVISIPKSTSSRTRIVPIESQ